MRITKITHLFIPISLLLAACGEDAEEKEQVAKDFKLEVYEEHEDTIKPFKVAEIMPYYQDDKWGYANKKGEIVIPCKYDKCGFFSEGMAWVTKNRKSGYIDTTGQLAIEHQYDEAGGFKNGAAIAKKSNYKGIIDQQNNVLLPFKYEELLFANDNLICFKQNRQWGILTLDGKQIINPIYDLSFEFVNGFATVKRDGKWGAVNQQGKETVECKYNEIKQTHGNDFIVQIKKDYNDEKYGVVDSLGNEIFPVTYKRIEEVINNAFILELDNEVAVINNKKEALVSFGYQDIRTGNTNLLAAKGSTGNWGFINLKNDTIIPFEYHKAEGFINNHAIVGKGKLGMIDINGEIVVPLEFDKVIYADKDIVKVYKEDKYGFYSLNGEKLTECKYDEIDYSIDVWEREQKIYVPIKEEKSPFGKFENGYAIVNINGRRGAIDKKGREIVKPYYHQFEPFNQNHLAVVNYNGAEGIINAKGELLTGLNFEHVLFNSESGYYYSLIFVQDENRNSTDINLGYFNLDGTHYSNATKGKIHVDSEEEQVLKIRAKYQEIVANLKIAPPATTYKTKDGIVLSMKSDRLIVNDNAIELSYEYYFDSQLNPKGPFFILKTDKSSGKALHDRYYYINEKIVRWVDKEGKKQIVANAMYAPEHQEHFLARYYQAAYDNQAILHKNPHNNEIGQIDRQVAQIETNIAAGKYKKGDIYESYEGEGGEKTEEYLDNQGRTIYKYDYSGGEYSWGHSKEYYNKGKLILTENNSERITFYGTKLSAFTTKTYHFKDGTQREYRTETFDGGDILYVSE